MLQRKQTIYLLLAFIATAVCLCLPIGQLVPEGMGASRDIYNMYMPEGFEATSLVPFLLLLLTCPINLFAIFSYKNRQLQARLCVCCLVLCLLWYVAVGLLAFVDSPAESHFSPQFASVLPMVSVILYIMARLGIVADERLVRAADRIR